ncbi:hypothetical protein Trydic_g18436 [Trypoxylus dichotomus]
MARTFTTREIDGFERDIKQMLKDKDAYELFERYLGTYYKHERNVLRLWKQSSSEEDRANCLQVLVDGENSVHRKFIEHLMGQ